MKRSQDSALLERAGGRRRSDFRVGRAGREKKKKMKEKGKGKGKVISGLERKPCIMISEGKGQKVNLNLSGRHGGPGLVGSRICEEVRFGFGRSGYTVCMYVTCGSLQRTTQATPNALRCTYVSMSD